MIKLIYGPKGSGKTKRIIAQANEALTNAKGDVVYITDTNEYTRVIDVKIRYQSANEKRINSPEELLAFIKGMISMDYDIEKVFIDGIARITNVELDVLEHFFKRLNKLTEEYGCDFIFTISSSLEDMPPYLQAYAK